MTTKADPLQLPTPVKGQDPWRGWQKELEGWSMLVNRLVNNPVLGGLATFAVATLPASAAVGAMAFASNGRKVGEAAGAGTGVPVYKTGVGTWRRLSDDTVVVA